VILGALFFYSSVFGGATVAYKTLVQASIMVLIGAGGLVISLKRR
jgi:lipid-A-disaccharide synthase-like uncharacterized protein